MRIPHASAVQVQVERIFRADNDYGPLLDSKFETTASLSNINDGGGCRESTRRSMAEPRKLGTTREFSRN